MNTPHAVRQNFEEKAAYLARQLPGMTVNDCGNFLLVDSGVPSDTFNVIVARGLTNATQLLDRGVGYFMSKRLPMALWYWADAADQSGIAALLAYGLTASETDVAMVADLAQVRLQAKAPPGLTIKLVENVDGLQQFAGVLVRLFGASAEAQGIAAYFRQFTHFTPDRFPALRYYIGIYQEQVVATGTLFVSSETSGIYDIVTDDAFRRKGIGSAMFAHLLQEATNLGRPYAVLQASPAGVGIYARTGFEAVGEVHVFENRVLLARSPSNLTPGPSPAQKAA
jgi:GNAT superfamily N-acetyltransferase